jgi:hypothetical protein
VYKIFPPGFAKYWNFDYTVNLCWLKVDGNEKLGGVGKGTVIQLQYGIVAIGGYLQYERVVFVLEIYFRFRLLQLYL